MLLPVLSGALGTAGEAVLLRSRVPRARDWWLRSTAAITLGAVLSATFLVATFPPSRIGTWSLTGLPAMLALNLVKSLVLGAAQASVLRRVTSRASTWIVAVAVVALAQGLFGWAVPVLAGGPLSADVALAAAGGVAALILGAVLLRLLEHAEGFRLTRRDVGGVTLGPLS